MQTLAVVPTWKGPTQARAEELRRSIAPDLYTTQVYRPRDAIDAKVDSLANAAAHLQHVVNVSSWSTEALGSALRVPGVLAVVRHLLVTPSAVGFSDGREIPMAMPLDQQAAEEVATLLLDIGLPRILPPGSSVKDLLRLGAIALDSSGEDFGVETPSRLRY